MNCTMKKYKLIAVFLLLGCLCSCTKFLDLPAKNERAVQSLDDIKSVLAGYLYGQANPVKLRPSVCLLCLPPKW